MKKFFLLELAMTVLLFSSCSKDKVDDAHNDINAAILSEYNVRMCDIQKYATAKSCGTKSNSEYDVEVLKFGSDTLAYLINFTDGFEIIAGDKRLDPIIAKGNTKYCIDSLNPNEMFWLDSELEYIYDLKNGVQTKSENSVNSFWLHLDGPVNNTKVEGDPIEDNRYWELIEIQDAGGADETSGHILKTVWNQRYPWNQCVPNNSTNDGKCPSGCVAVAGAQMLYYLHEKLGKPASFYTNGQCVGNVDNHTFYFWDSDTSAFSNMALNLQSDEQSKYRSSLLIGWVGSEVGMDYGDNGSGAKITDLKRNVFNGSGINCTYTENFDRNVIWTQVLSNEPVLLGGYRNKKTVLGLFPKYSNGHAWIVDGYVISHSIKRYIYEWKSKTQNDLYEYGERKEEFVTEDYKYVLMNWGWDYSAHDTWYSLMGDWNYDEDHNYRYDRCMVYEFYN